MNKSLNGKVAVAAGPLTEILASIVQTLLQEGATVIVPAKSAAEITRLSTSLAGMDTRKLVTLLTDYPDYDKVSEISENITEQYGSIDMAIICFNAGTPATASHLIETDMMDWEKMIDNNITALFVSACTVLTSMIKNNKGMFVSVIDSIGFDSKNSAAVARLSAYMQTEMAKMFFEEAKIHNVRCYHLSVSNDTAATVSGSLPYRKKNPQKNIIGDFIVQLYHGKNGTSKNPLQTLKITAQTNNAKII